MSKLLSYVQLKRAMKLQKELKTLNVVHASYFKSSDPIQKNLFEDKIIYL